MAGERERAGIFFEPGRLFTPSVFPVVPAQCDCRGRREDSGFFGGKYHVVREAIIALRVVEPASDETRQHIPSLAASFEPTEGEGLPLGGVVWCAQRFELLRESFRKRGMPSDGAEAGTAGDKSAGGGGENQLQGHGKC